MSRAGKGGGHHHRNRKRRPALSGDHRAQRKAVRARGEARERDLESRGGAPRLAFPADVIAAAMLDGPLTEARGGRRER